MNNLNIAMGMDAADPHFKSHVIDLLHYSQIDMTHNFIVDEITKNMRETVDAIFGPLALLAVLTQAARKQVWFAVLAKLQVDNKTEAIRVDQASRSQVLTLLLASQKPISTWAVCPVTE